VPMSIEDLVESLSAVLAAPEADVDDEYAEAAQEAREEEQKELDEQRSEAASTVAQLAASDDAEWNASAIEGGLLAALGVALVQGSGEARDDCLRALLSLSSGLPGAQLLGAADLLDALLSTLDPLIPVPPAPVVEGGDEEEKEGVADGKEAEAEAEAEVEAEEEQEEEKAGDEDAEEAFQPCARGFDVLERICAGDGRDVRAELVQHAGLRQLLLKGVGSAADDDAGVSQLAALSCLVVLSRAGDAEAQSVLVAEAGVVGVLSALLGPDFDGLDGRPRARSTCLRVLSNLTASFDVRKPMLDVVPMLLGVVQKDSTIETSMARAEALRGLSNLAQHGLRCKTVEGQLERYKAFEIIRTAVEVQQ